MVQAVYSCQERLRSVSVRGYRGALRCARTVGPGVPCGRSLRTPGTPAPLRPVAGPEERLDQLEVELVVQRMPKDPATSPRNDLLPSPARCEHLQKSGGSVDPSVEQPVPLFLQVVPGDESLRELSPV